MLGSMLALRSENLNLIPKKKLNKTKQIHKRLQCDTFEISVLGRQREKEILDRLLVSQSNLLSGFHANEGPSQCPTIITKT